MLASICLATYDRAAILAQVLQSIYSQKVPFPLEVIIVDDGSPTNDSERVCNAYASQGIRYERIERPPGIRNPCTPRNVAYRLAQGDVLICQSDDVVHVTPNAIEQLVALLTPGHFVIANVFCLNRHGQVCGEYTGPKRPVPYFFLGSVYRSDLYAVGGNDEDFAIATAYDDVWFGDCLIHGLKLQPVHTTSVVGHHLWHPRRNVLKQEADSGQVYAWKLDAATRGEIPFCASGGSWVEPDSTQEVFTRLYHRWAFGRGESRSGAGSTYQATQAVRRAIPKLLSDFSIVSMLDIPCGDYNWMQHVALPCAYIGADIVVPLIEENRGKYPGIDFRCLDLVTSDLPRVDLVLCRDCFGHLSQQDVLRAFSNLKRSGSRYLLATTFSNHPCNESIATGRWTPYNLQAAPFNLPTPLYQIDEECREYPPDFADKQLALWRIEDLGCVAL